MQNPTIIPANPSHLDFVLSELKEFADFVGTEKKLFGDPAYVKLQLELIMKDHVFFVAEADGVPIGFIFGFLTPHYFNPEIKILTELAWWIVPEHRGKSEAGFDLLKTFIESGREKADWVAFGLNEKTLFKSDRLVELGFKFFERSYLLQFQK